MTCSYHPATLAAAHAAVRDRIDGGSGPGKVKCYTGPRPSGGAAAAATGILVGTGVCADPCGTVDGATGRLTLAAIPRITAGASGNIGYVRITDSADNAVVDLEAVTGDEAVPGYAVFSNLAAVAGGYIDLASVTVG